MQSYRANRYAPRCTFPRYSPLSCCTARAFGTSMCESNVYLATSEGEQLVLADVTSIKPEGDGYRLANLFGEQVSLRGRIKDIDLLKHRVVFEDIP